MKRDALYIKLGDADHGKLGWMYRDMKHKEWVSRQLKKDPTMKVLRGEKTPRPEPEWKNRVTDEMVKEEK